MPCVPIVGPDTLEVRVVRAEIVRPLAVGVDRGRRFRCTFQHFGLNPLGFDLTDAGA